METGASAPVFIAVRAGVERPRGDPTVKRVRLCGLAHIQQPVFATRCTQREAGCARMEPGNPFG
jgi:hypothetical protein